MSTYICLFLLAIGSLLPAHARTFDPSLRVSARIGPAVTSAGGNISAQQGTAFGYSTGLTFSLPMSEHFWLQTELLYTRKAYNYSYRLTQDRVIHPDVALHYLDIPAIMRFVISPDLSGNIHIDLGAYIGFLMGGSIEAPVPFELENSNNAEFGMVLGTGTDFTAIGTRFGVDLRYFGGLASLEEVDDALYPLVPPESGGSTAHSHDPFELTSALSLTASVFF